MIDIINQTPIEYSKQSRDYQIIARLYTALFNMNKMYVDNMSIWNSDIDNRLTTLRAKTLNFNPRHSWDLDALDGAVSSFKYIMYNKGTETAINYCLTILMRINKLRGTAEAKIEDNHITLSIPAQLASIGVLTDLFDYVIPAGMTYRIKEFKVLDIDSPTNLIEMDELANPPKKILTQNMGIYSGTEGEGNQGYSIYHNMVSSKNDEL